MQSHTSQFYLTLLDQMGTAEIPHLVGDLRAHLIGTYQQLCTWGSADVVCIAGLFHAAYGTAAFERPFQSPSNRAYLSQQIGQAAEQLVYLYCACDRDVLYPQIGRQDTVQFRNRFTQQTQSLSALELSQLCEITLANELDVVSRDPALKAQHRDWFIELFQRFEGIVSATAFSAFQDAFMRD